MMEKNLYRILAAVYVAVGAYTFFLSGIDRAPLGAVSLLFLLVPPTAEWLLRMKLGYPLKIAVLFFCLLGYGLGTALRWFDYPFGFDKIAHFLSGILFTLIGLCFYARISGSSDRLHRKLLQISYAFFFSMGVAVVWEIGEFSGFLLTGHDSQHHLSTGVFDTMEDILACVLGSFVMALDYWIYTRKGKSLFMGIVLGFDKANEH